MGSLFENNQFHLEYPNDIDDYRMKIPWWLILSPFSNNKYISGRLFVKKNKPSATMEFPFENNQLSLRYPNDIDEYKTRIPWWLILSFFINNKSPLVY